MKYVFFTSAMFFLAIGCAPNSRVDAGSEEDRIRELISTTESFNNAADTLGWAGLFAREFVYMPPGMNEVTIREDLIDVAATAFGEYRTQIQIIPREIVVSGDWAFARSQVTGSWESRADGSSGPIDMKQLVLYRKTSEGWRIARLINNSNR
jgi:ketosteroid isomerase-like protein